MISLTFALTHYNGRMWGLTLWIWHRYLSASFSV